MTLLILLVANQDRLHLLARYIMMMIYYSIVNIMSAVLLSYNFSIFNIMSALWLSYNYSMFNIMSTILLSCSWASCNMISAIFQVTSRTKVIVMEFCTHGTLYNLLDQPENSFGLSEEEFLLVLSQVSKWTPARAPDPSLDLCPDLVVCWLYGSSFIFL